jgi:hypothetical protein
MIPGRRKVPLKPAVFAACLIFCVSTGRANDVKMMKSPDGIYSAHITRVTKSPALPPEFIVEIRNTEHRPEVKGDYTSKSGEQGLSLHHGAWTPDSRFFIYTTLSSGGHMAWQYLTFFFDRRDGKIHDFSDFLSPVAEGAFSLNPPDIITITVWTPLTTEKPLDESIALPISFRMSDLKKSK